MPSKSLSRRSVMGTAVLGAAGLATDHLACQALLHYLEDQEDYLVGTQRLKKGNPRIPFGELERELGLER